MGWTVLIEAGSPCPIVVRVTEQGGANVTRLLSCLFTYWKAAEPEPKVTVTQIPTGELQDPAIEWDPVLGARCYQAVWNQQLVRTSVTALGERCCVGARALCDPNQQGQHKQFRVTGLAKPAAGLIIWGYTEGLRDPGMLETRSTSAARNTLCLSYWSYGPRLALDYGRSAGATINAAEYGTVCLGDGWQLPPQKAMPDELDDAIRAAAVTWVQQNGHAGQDPWSYLRAEASDGTDWDNRFVRGPNPAVTHGATNITVEYPDAQQPHDEREVTTVYCHVATQQDGTTPLKPSDTVIAPEGVTGPVADRYGLRRRASLYPASGNSKEGRQHAYQSHVRYLSVTLVRPVKRGGPLSG